MNSSCNYHFKKNIWLFWHQGWENAPELIKICKDSCIDNNPDWNINLLDLNGNIIQSQQNVFTSHIFSGLYPGTYIAQIIEPVSGCSGTKSFIINQDSIIFFNMSI